ncbi:hypothetical protein CR513_34176, partial [Mucuna pruriens]
MQPMNGGEIKETFPNECLLAITSSFPGSWFADIVNYIISWVFPLNFTLHETKKLHTNVKHYLWDESYHFKVAILCRPYLKLQTSNLDNLGSLGKLRQESITSLYSSTQFDHLNVSTTLSQIKVLELSMDTPFRPGWSLCQLNNTVKEVKSKRKENQLGKKEANPL